MPEMTTNVQWTAEETKRAGLLAFSSIAALNITRRLIKDRRLGPGEALAGIAAACLLWREFGRRRDHEVPEAFVEPADDAAQGKPADAGAAQA